MSEHPAAAPQPIVYQRSRLGRVSLFFKCALACVFLQAIMAALVWGAIGAWIFNSASPDWVHGLGIALVLLMIPATWASCNLSEPTRLVLREDDLLIGGALIKRRVRYDDVRLLRLEELDELVSRSTRLVVQPKRGGSRRVVLLKDDAKECFHALRHLCPQAAAMEFDHEVYAPVDEAHFAEGRRTLSQTLFRKASRASIAAIALGLFSAMVLTGAIASGTISQHPVRALFSIGLPFVGALFTGWQAVHFWRMRAAIRTPQVQIIEIGDEDDADDAADDDDAEALFVAPADQTVAGTR